MIELNSLTKRYGTRVAVDDLTVAVRSGIVTGFLGPNGAGKSTTMRLILGLDRPTDGIALIDGQPYSSFRAPLRKVGALLDARAVRRGITARNHLRSLAQTHGIDAVRVDHVLESVGLSAVADRRVGSFSLGMSQRLGIAAALIADPEVLILDEPINGLDPDGVLWIRQMLRDFASEGRTVLVSSHLMSEMALTADHLIVIGQGRLIADASIAELLATVETGVVRVGTSTPSPLAAALVNSGGTVTEIETNLIEVRGLPPERIGALAVEHRIVLRELSVRRASLEEAYMRLTRPLVEYEAPAGRTA